MIRRNTILPFFHISLGYTIFYLSIILLLPLSVLLFQILKISFRDFINIISNEQILYACRLSILTSLMAALFNVFFGFLVAWVLVRYSFPGKQIIDALIDIPFALPTSIAGITLASIYSSNGWIGKFLDPFGIKISFTPIGIVVALIFVGLPFVVRTIEPVLREFDIEAEEAAKCLGASKSQIFYKIILPTVMPSLITGFILAFARGLGEYGSVIFISSNIPKISEILPLVIYTKLEQFDFIAASSIAILMLFCSFIMILILNILQKWSNKHNYVQ